MYGLVLMQICIYRRVHVYKYAYMYVCKLRATSYFIIRKLFVDFYATFVLNFSAQIFINTRKCMYVCIHIHLHITLVSLNVLHCSISFI